MQDLAKIYGENCENIAGTVELPVGVVELKVNGGVVSVPLATTERILVASVNRGSKAIWLSGGATVSVRRIGITRAPVYKVVGRVRSEGFYRAWFKAHMAELNEILSVLSAHTSIMRIVVKKYKGLIYVKFFFNTEDAMGMNMATKACDAMNSFICESLGLSCVALSSNFCSDKKGSLVVANEGRGFKVKAAVKLSVSVLSEVLKTNAYDLMQVYRAKIVQGSALSNAIGRNAHHANNIAAIFTATGQDLAHVVEGSLGKTIISVRGSDVEFCVTMPAILCGIIGGGTELPKQRSWLNSMKVKSSSELAAIIGAAVLAGEISLLASLAEGSLAEAHSGMKIKQ